MQYLTILPMDMHTLPAAVASGRAKLQAPATIHGLLPLNQCCMHSSAAAAIPAAGAPRANSSFFCDSTATTCWALMELAASHRVAGDTCISALNGMLVSYPSDIKQRMVEVRPA